MTNNTTQEMSNNTKFYAAISPNAYTVHHSLDYIAQWMEQYEAFYFCQTNTVEEANQLTSTIIYYNQTLHIPNEQWFTKLCRGEHNTKLNYTSPSPMIPGSAISITNGGELMESNKLALWVVISDQGYGIADNAYTLKGMIEAENLTNVIALKSFSLAAANASGRQRYTRRYNCLFPRAILYLPQGDLPVNRFYKTPNYEQLKQYSPQLMEWENLIKKDMFL